MESSPENTTTSTNTNTTTSTTPSSPVRLFISPPFGNYVNLPYCTSIKGSFTLEPRPGLLGQIWKTLRYSTVYGGWTNKIGLRNKGIEWAVEQYTHTDDARSVISVAIMHTEEIPQFLKIIPDEMNLELNVSCPNTEEALVHTQLQGFLNPRRKWCSIKLSPHTPTALIDMYYEQGFRQFHCCNTLPIAEGGLSGIRLIPYTSYLVDYIRQQYPDADIVAGGGVRSFTTIQHYERQGANFISVSSLLFNPLRFAWLYANYYFRAARAMT